MLESMRRLHPRDAVSKGVCVDADGAMLGPECVLVRRTPDGYRGVSRAESRQIQRLLLAATDDPDWLYEQGQRIAQALDRGEVALAQIYGLRIPVNDLDGRQLKRLAAIAATAKAGFNPAQPRAPAGQGDGGRWIDAGGGTATDPQVDLTGVGSDDGAARLQPRPIGVRSDTGHAGAKVTLRTRSPI